MLTTVFSRAFANLSLWGIIRIFLICMVCYIAAWIALAWGISELFQWLSSGYAVDSWVMHLAGGSVGFIAAWFLFPILYPLLISFFDEQMAAIIEEKDYPGLSPSNPPFWPTFMQDVGFTIKALLLNLLCLPLYFIPLLGIALYYSLNGYLLGMQFFRMSAGRRVSIEEAKQLMSQARGTIFLSGLAVSVSATIPLLNLIAPVMGVASMLHLFHLLHYEKSHPQQQILPPQA